MDRAVLRSRDVLVRSRAGLINHVRGTAKAMGQSPGEMLCAKLSPSGWQRRFHLHCHAALAPVLEQIATLSDSIRAYDRELEAMATKRYPETELLEQVDAASVC